MESSSRSKAFLDGGCLPIWSALLPELLLRKWLEEAWGQLSTLCLCLCARAARGNSLLWLLLLQQKRLPGPREMEKAPYPQKKPLSLKQRKPTRLRVADGWETPLLAGFPQIFQLQSQEVSPEPNHFPNPFSASPTFYSTLAENH